MNVIHSDSKYWIPPGKSVQVQGHNIQGGMFYLGGHLDIAVEPTRSVGSPDYSMTFYPREKLSYQTLQSDQRAAYLHWLASDRKLPEVPLIYPRLFFQGLEHRLFVEGDYDIELIAAVFELLIQYPRITYEVPLIPWLHFWGHFNGPEHYYEVLRWLRELGRRVSSPRDLSLALFNLAQSKRPLDVELALDVVVLHPKLHPKSCSPDLGDMKSTFVAQFQRKFPTGISLRLTQENSEVCYPADSPDLANAVRDAGGPKMLSWKVPDIWKANDNFMGVIGLWNDLVRDTLAPKLTVDFGELEALTKETRSIQATLAERLKDQTESPKTPSGIGSPVVRPEPTSPNPGLDSRYRAMLQALIRQLQWNQKPFEELARKHGLMPWAFYQAVNQWAAEAFKDLILEGQELIHINSKLINPIQKYLYE